MYREAFRNTDAPALIADSEFVVRDVNAGGRTFLGYEPDDIVGTSVSELVDDDETYNDMVDYLAAGESWHGRFVAKTGDGEHVYGYGSADPLVVDDVVEGIVVVFADRTKQQYENASEVLNRLLRHDLRNELNILYGHIQQAQSTADANESAENLERAKQKVIQIVHKSERARDLRDLLERSSVTANRPVRLDIVLNNAMVQVMQEYPDATFRFEVFPEVVVSADDLLSTAVEAVLENAVTHNDSDDPVVDVDVEARSDQVVLAIADNGPGVPKSQRNLIFGREEYDQLHHGTGISLFFADSVFDSYGGEIWVEDNEPRGAVFKIRLNRA